MDWDGIKKKVVVAVIAGIILASGGWLLNRLLTPGDQPVKAEMEWLDLANPLYLADSKTVQALDNAIAGHFIVNDFSKFIARLQFEHTIRVGLIKFSNSTNARTKEIEVSIDGAALFSSGAVDQSSAGRSALKLKSLDPHSSAIVYFIVREWLSFSKGPVKAIHDDRSVDVVRQELPDDIPFYSAAVTKFPFVVMIFILIGALVVALLLCALAFDFFVKDKFKFQAKNTSKNQIKRQIEFIEYVKTNYPEKMPAVEDKRA